MDGKKLLNPNEAYRRSDKGTGVPGIESASFVCPHAHCRVYAQHKWGHIQSATVFHPGGGVGGRNISKSDRIVFSYCTSCAQESIFVNGALIFPLQSDAPDPSKGFPEELLPDFLEARVILPYSPRGAAALLRLVVQKLLPIIGATKKEINAAIGELVEKGVLSVRLQQALDSVRVIGNEAVHPGEMDLRDDDATAHALFRLVNFVVEKAIVEPAAIAEIYGSLPPRKLEGIGQRDAK